MRANIFCAPVHTTIVDALLGDGYDVWLENWRASIDFAPNQWTLGNGQIPYVPWTNLSDFVIDDNAQTLAENATIAVVGDWGTGQSEALAVLEAVASKNPQVVIHLGDVYYSGTDPRTATVFLR